MSEFYVIRKTRCASCYGTGRNHDAAYRRAALGDGCLTSAQKAVLKENGAACLTCLGTGEEREEVSLQEALHAIQSLDEQE